MMKYRWELEDFLNHCRKVARFNVGKQFCDEDVSDDESECGLQGTETMEVHGEAAFEQVVEDPSDAEI